jgi:hypothetical protein
MKRTFDEPPGHIERFNGAGSMEQAIANFHDRREADPTMQIWAQSVNTKNSKRYLVGPHRLLHHEFLQQVVRIGDELYLAHEPCRLVFDLDGKKMTAEEMKALVLAIKDRCDVALKARYGVEATMFELDGSREEKQSRHLFFDGAIFRTLGDMERFVLTDIRPGLPAGIDPAVVDPAVYHGSSRCLRLPLAAKYGEHVVLKPIWNKKPFEFARCMVWVLPEHRPQQLLTMAPDRPDEEEAPREVVRRITRALSNYNPVIRENTVSKLCCLLNGIKCPVKGEQHQNNNTAFVCWFSRDALQRPCVSHCHFKCLDPVCDTDNHVIWMPRYPMDLVAFPEKLNPVNWEEP